MSDITLSDVISEYGYDAYLLTTGETGPHISNVTVALEKSTVKCSVGPSSAGNVALDPRVSFFWPPIEAGGYGMIINGTVTGIERFKSAAKIEVRLTKSVLHRPGPKSPESDGPCTSDCKRVLLGE